MIVEALTFDDVLIKPCASSVLPNQTELTTNITSAIKLNIPIIAILDTNSDPEGIDFPIPGNDDARRSIDLYCSLVKETINNAKKNIPEDTKKNGEQKVITPKSSSSPLKKKIN